MGVLTTASWVVGRINFGDTLRHLGRSLLCSWRSVHGGLGAGPACDLLLSSRETQVRGCLGERSAHYRSCLKQTLGVWCLKLYRRQPINYLVFRSLWECFKLNGTFLKRTSILKKMPRGIWIMVQVFSHIWEKKQN